MTGPRLDTVLLAFDTATPAVTVALHDGDEVVAEESAVDARRHGELLAPGIDRVLARPGRPRRPDRHRGRAPGPGRTPACGSAWSPPGHSAARWASRSTACAPWTCWRRRRPGAAAASSWWPPTPAASEVYWAATSSGRPARSARPPGPRPGGQPAGRRPVRGRPVVGRGAGLYPDQLRPVREPHDPAAACLAAPRRAAARRRRADPERADAAVPAPARRAEGRAGASGPS